MHPALAPALDLMRPPALPTPCRRCGSLASLQTDEWVLSTFESAIDFFIFTGNDLMVSYSVCSRLGLRGMGSTLAGLGLPDASTLLTLGPGQYKED